ncbi:hypothetical protein NUACC26_013470 [Scytonema sp. NUACC26]
MTPAKLEKLSQIFRVMERKFTMNNHTIQINDTTLRDGEQAVGIAFNVEEKITIATLLDSIGVQELEVGIPAMGIEEAESVLILL